MENNYELKRFPQRLDFYYQTIAIYSIVLLAYSLLRGTIEGGTITIRIIDPISILIVVFIIGTLIALLYDLAKRREIIISDEYIIFKAGKKEKKYHISEIERISIASDKTLNFRSNYRTAMIKVPSRKRAVRLRFSSYQNDKELAQEIINIKKRIG